MNLSWGVLCLFYAGFSLSAVAKLNLNLPEESTNRKEDFSLKWHEERKMAGVEPGLKWHQQVEKDKALQEREELKREIERETRSGSPFSASSDPLYRQHVTNPNFDSFDKDRNDRDNYNIRLNKKFE